MIAKAFKRMAEDHKHHPIFIAIMVVLCITIAYLMILLREGNVSFGPLIMTAAIAYTIRLIFYLFVPSICEKQGCHNHRWDDEDEHERPIN